MQKTRKLYFKWILLSVLRVLVTVAPLGICLLVNREEYFTAPGQSVKLTIGGLMCVVLLFLAVLGKLKMPRRAVAVFMALSLSWLFSAILDDLILLLFLWLMGEIADLMVAPFALRAGENIRLGRAARVTAQAVAEQMKGGGRV